MEVIVTYGYNVLSALREFKEKVRKEIEILTTMNFGGHNNRGKRNIYARRKKEGGLTMSFIVAIDGPAGTGKGLLQN